MYILYLIGLIIAENKGRSQYYTASVKPFVDIAFGLKEIGIESVLFLPYSEEQLVQKLHDVTHNQVEIVFYNKSNLKMKLEVSKVKYIMIDDNISAMNRILSLHLEKVKTIVYTQYLFGINSNRSNLRRKSMKLLIASFLPWRLLTYFYRRNIAKFDFIIANSRMCEYLLDKFYDLQSSGVVYPPVGVDMRELIPQNKESAKKEGVLIFVGNSKNDFFLRDLRLETLRLKKS